MSNSFFLLYIQTVHRTTDEQTLHINDKTLLSRINRKIQIRFQIIFS